MDITGKLIVKMDEQQVSEKFKKRDFVIETGDQYPQKIQMQLVQSKTDLIDKFNIGDEIKAYINIRGREWTSKEGKVSYFNTIEAWKIEGIQGESTPQPTESNDAVIAAPEEDGLPF
jgi:translation initiation factor IF-3